MISEWLKIDNVDRKIITLIADNPLMTHIEISKVINKSQPTVGARIKKLGEMGALQFQGGVNFKQNDLILMQVEFHTRDPNRIFELVDECVFVLNAFRMTGKRNVCCYITGDSLVEIESFVNQHFRSSSEISDISMRVITEIARDFILPVKF